MAHKVRLHLTAMGIGSRVFLDGVEITDITAVKVEAGVDTATSLTLTLINVDIESDGDVVRDVTTMRSDVAREFRRA